MLTLVIPVFKKSSWSEWTLAITTSTLCSVLSSSDNVLITLTGSIKVKSSANVEVIDVIWSEPITPIIPTRKPFSKVLIVYLSPKSA